MCVITSTKGKIEHSSKRGNFAQGFRCGSNLVRISQCAVKGSSRSRVILMRGIGEKFSQCAAKGPSRSRMTLMRSFRSEDFDDFRWATLDYFWGELAERRKLLFLGGGRSKAHFCLHCNETLPKNLIFSFFYLSMTSK